LINKAKSI